MPLSKPNFSLSIGFYLLGHYTPDDSYIKIIGKQIEDNWIEVVIEDAGIGIEPDHLELIFEKFYQTGKATFHSSGKTSFKGGGPGLGLTIAKSIITAHDGRIWAEAQAMMKNPFLVVNFIFNSRSGAARNGMMSAEC